MTENPKTTLKAEYNGTESPISGRDNLYKGEMLVLTSKTAQGLEKSIYIRDTFIKENTIHMDAASEDLALTYNVNTLKELIKKEIINEGDGEELIKGIKEEEALMKTYAEWVQQNIDASEEEKKKYFDELIPTNNEEKVKKQEKISYSIRKLIAIRENIQNFQNNNVLTPLFLENLNPKTDFGMTKTVADRLNHLPELLYKSTFDPIIDNKWRLSAKIMGKNNDDLSVELEYNFIASTQEEARRIAESYKDSLKKGGLKVLLAYWKMANEIGQFVYTSHISQIMDRASSDTRKSYHNMEERKRFWAHSRTLENTKITIPFELKKINNKGKPASKLVKAEHRLIEILNRSMEEEDGCPIEVKVRVLDTTVFENQSQIATAIANNILSLNENDIMLGFSLEVRNTQVGEKSGTISIDNNRLIEKGNLTTTANSNPRMAKKRAKEKLDRLKDAQVGVVEWENSKDGVIIHKPKRPPRTKKKGIKDKNI